MIKWISGGKKQNTVSYWNSENRIHLWLYKCIQKSDNLFKSMPLSNTCFHFFACKCDVISHYHALQLFSLAWGWYTAIHMSTSKNKIQLIKSLEKKRFNLSPQRRILHVSHWNVSEFRGLRDCWAGLLHLDRDSYWVHLSLGSDKGLRANHESDKCSYLWLCLLVFGFTKKL